MIELLAASIVLLIIITVIGVSYHKGRQRFKRCKCTRN